MLIAWGHGGMAPVSALDPGKKHQAPAALFRWKAPPTSSVQEAGPPSETVWRSQRKGT